MKRFTVIFRFSLFISLSLMLVCVGCTSSDPTQNGIIYGGNLIGNGEQTFEIRDHQYIRRGTYVMRGWCYITNGSTLTIEAGTVIKGDKATRAALIVEPGGKLIARGTVDAPIVFTSAMPDGEQRPGDWGGIIVCGNARNNQGIMQIEGGPRTLHGGSNDADNSGVLSYLRIEYAGHPFKKDQEINGLTFGSVGSGTQVDHIQVSYSNDDAFEWFGGTVNCTHLVAYRAWDDDFDADNGYRGTCTNLLGIRHPRLADVTQSHAFECSNNGQDSPATPITAPRFEQVTIFGPADVDPNFVNTPAYINGGNLRPSNESLLGLFGAALKLDVHTQISIVGATISGYPSQLEGTPGTMEDVRFEERRQVVYPEWTKGWCKF